MKKVKSPAFFGIILIAAGLLFLLRNLGYVDISILEVFSVYWPAGIILTGVAIIYRRGDIGFVILAFTFVLAVINGVGQMGPMHMYGNFWMPGMNCVSGSGNVSSDIRNLVEFKSVSASSRVNVYLEKGVESRAIVEAEENIINLVKTEAKDGKLEVYIDSCIRNVKPVNVYVTFQDVEKLSASSAARIIVEPEVKGDKVELDASSSGVIEVEVDAREVTADAVSAARITVSGDADIFFADASSSGMVNAFELVARDVSADASSAGIVQVYASEKLDAKTSSAGKVQYTGNPTDFDKYETSSGIVERMD